MPKIDTLDALGNAITKILTTNIQDLPQICPRYPSKSVEMSMICQKFAKYMPKICQIYA